MNDATLRVKKYDKLFGTWYEVLNYVTGESLTFDYAQDVIEWLEAYEPAAIVIWNI